MPKIKITKGKRNGNPCIRDTRIAVHDILGYLAAGMSYDQVLEDFPSLNKDDILAALSYAAESVRVK